jgi:Icc protein
MTETNNHSIVNIAVNDASTPIRVVQITDCHLGKDAGEQLVGMDTDISLDHVLNQLKAEQTTAELLLATGDLSNHGTQEAYTRLFNKLQALSIPNAWLAGNHDSRDLMVETVGEACMPRAVTLGRWLILMLDSAVPGQVGGELGEQELARIQPLLNAAPNAEHVLVCLHHQPVPIGCEWLDEQQLADSDALIAILAKEPRLRGIIWGHVHQAFSSQDSRLPNVKLLSAPSTCIQFAPNSVGFKLDECAPGYRWFDLHPDGRIDSDIARLQNIDLDVDYNSQGY